MIDITREEIDNLVNKFIKWIKDETHIEIKGEGQYAVIDTPFLDPLNDLIQLYLKKTGKDTWQLSDMGYTIQNLKMLEVNINRVLPIIEDNIRINGISLTDGEILTDFSTKDFAQKKFDILNAIIRISDLYELRSSGRINIFKQLVMEFFDEKSVPIIPDLRLTGQSGLNFHFDFAIPRRNGNSEKLGKIINTPTKQVVEALLFEWIDVRQNREHGAQGLAVLNDEKSISSNLIDGMKQNDVLTMLWSKKEPFLKKHMV